MVQEYPRSKISYGMTHASLKNSSISQPPWRIPSTELQNRTNEDINDQRRGRRPSRDENPIDRRGGHITQECHGFNQITRRRISTFQGSYVKSQRIYCKERSVDQELGNTMTTKKESDMLRRIYVRKRKEEERREEQRIEEDLEEME
ncbi:hypothetical protein F2Q68_00040077 [Brassica cretica]|uniref:Uncharacterized protein n=1 Tax=Brassica cretica TaxID=69181 RepID=A0A8S9MHI7_BRACR|nr:hypothetical protein F2Q68_00040077 [Brassica cretica]